LRKREGGSPKKESKEFEEFKEWATVNWRGAALEHI
jgi:hypothetical protein